ncbi:class I SAM-dependent methyltransferase [Merismopedia glauca]|uniref:SAM-dependent methyltransferase n=1 Tax=Merismopedia glauca CCAP 1448/3 TaxID=1296344 RepID=A0A2T1C879_9CYAN|nr:class I SAM-dependent methyltransferase [Merismopedia glauca]PSB04449.1 SAM-dependent methyltransferase [Merismopedia glauca CCAP 1448/3]
MKQIYNVHLRKTAMYKWNPEDYQQNSTGQQKLAQDLLEKVKLNGNERILDLGCGDGKITAQIAKCVPQGFVLGTDFSEEMIEFAKQKFPSTDFPNLNFEWRDARDLNYDAQFDLIVSFSCLHWIKEHLLVLEGIERSLKPSGKAILMFGGKGNAKEIQESANKIVAQPRWQQYFQDFVFPYAFYGVEEYREWLSAVGLKPQRLELVPKDMTHQGKEGLKAWLRTTWMPYTSRIPVELQADFIEDMATQFLSHNPVDAEGLVHVGMVRLEVEAIHRG